MSKHHLNKLKGIRENVKLAGHTTFKIGGPAKYFYIAKTIDDLVEVIQLAQNLKIPYFILAGGSNILVSDKGFNGLVIRIQNTKYKILNAKIIAEAGVKLTELTNVSVKNGLSGLEWAIGIPGTIGGAVRNNAGAFGQSMGDIVEEVKTLTSSLDNPGCQFGYRDSIFKHNKDIILEARLKLKKRNRQKSKKMINEYLTQRKKSQPLKYPSAGCVFKNPPGESAGRLIDQCGLKGRQIGEAQISPIHANFIINRNQAKAEDVVKLINLIKQQVRAKFNIGLKEEIEYVGF